MVYSTVEEDQSIDNRSQTEIEHSQALNYESTQSLVSLNLTPLHPLVPIDFVNNSGNRQSLFQPKTSRGSEWSMNSQAPKDRIQNYIQECPTPSQADQLFGSQELQQYGLNRLPQSANNDPVMISVNLVESQPPVDAGNVELIEIDDDDNTLMNADTVPLAITTSPDTVLEMPESSRGIDPKENAKPFTVLHTSVASQNQTLIRNLLQSQISQAVAAAIAPVEPTLKVSNPLTENTHLNQLLNVAASTPSAIVPSVQVPVPEVENNTVQNVEEVVIEPRAETPEYDSDIARNIKKEHDTQYAPYTDSVQILPNEPSVIELLDDTEANSCPLTFEDDVEPQRIQVRFMHGYG